MLCYVMKWNEMKYDMICYVMLCLYVMLCYVYVMLCYTYFVQKVICGYFSVKEFKLGCSKLWLSCTLKINDRQCVFSQFTIILRLQCMSLSSNHFPWLLGGIEAFSFIRHSWILWSWVMISCVLSCNVLQQISLCDIRDSWFWCYIYLWRRYSLENSGRYLTDL